jgi:hypothetical protein
VDGGGWTDQVVSWIAGIGGAFGGLFAFLAWNDSRHHKMQENLLNLIAHRRIAAAKLRKRLWSEKYAGVLAGGLDWIERTYGPKRGGYALGLSGVLALVYAWAFFCVMWAFGASDGTVLGQTVSRPVDQAVRVPGGIILAALPPGLYMFFRWVAARATSWFMPIDSRLHRRGDQRQRWGMRGIFAVATSIVSIAIVIFVGLGIDFALSANGIGFFIGIFAIFGSVSGN